MRLDKYLVAALALIAVTTGCGDEKSRAQLAAVLESAESIELYSLAVWPGLAAFATKDEAAIGTDSFHGWRVLGKISLADPAQRKKLIGDVVSAADCFGDDCSRPMCFDPRHGIRITTKGANADFVICFECKQAKVYGGGILGFTIADTPESNFDAMLGLARIALSRNLEKRKATPTPLFAAASAGAYKDVIALIEKGTKPDEKWDGRSPLREAAWLGHDEVIHVLLDAGAKIEGDGSGRTPLQEAAYGGHLEAVKLLVSRGAVVGAKDSSGDTALYLAAHRGNPAVVAFLLEKGADPNVPSIDGGRTPLHVAAGKGNAAIVKLMLARGGDPAFRSRLNKTPLDEAREDKHAEVVRLMESHAPR